jgi:hypothetical protein
MSMADPSPMSSRNDGLVQPTCATAESPGPPGPPGPQRQWRQRLERARYEAERARRQFDAVEPENRLVARTLERQWEQALADELLLQAEHERFMASQSLPFLGH